MSADAFPANNDPWFHMFCKWIHEFSWLNSPIHVFPYVNSPDSVNKFGVSTRVYLYREIMSFSHDDTYQWNRTSSDPVRLVSNSFKTRDNRQNTCVYSREYTWIHILVERYQLWTSMPHDTNWFRNGSLFAGLGSKNKDVSSKSVTCQCSDITPTIVVHLLIVVICLELLHSWSSSFASWCMLNFESLAES